MIKNDKHLFEHEIDEDSVIELPGNYFSKGIDESHFDSDSSQKNWHAIRIVTALMLAFALAYTIKMLLEGQPTIALAILAAFGVGYLINIKKPA